MKGPTLRGQLRLLKSHNVEINIKKSRKKSEYDMVIPDWGKVTGLSEDVVIKLLHTKLITEMRKKVGLEP